MEKNLVSLSLLIVLSGISTSLSATDNKTTSLLGTSYEVIEDRGGRSIENYLPALKYDDVMAKANNTRIRSTNARTLVREMANAQYPVVSRLLSVGRVTEEETKHVMYELATHPMFIIGYDSVSIEWLRSNIDYLKEHRAIGLVVNVESKRQMDELKSLIDNKVVLQALPGDDIAQTLQISHYPFYVDNQGVMY